MAGAEEPSLVPVVTTKLSRAWAIFATVNSALENLTWIATGDGPVADFFRNTLFPRPCQSSNGPPGARRGPQDEKSR